MSDTLDAVASWMCEQDALTTRELAADPPAACRVLRRRAAELTYDHHAALCVMLFSDPPSVPPGEAGLWAPTRMAVEMVYNGPDIYQDPRTAQLLLALARTTRVLRQVPEGAASVIRAWLAEDHRQRLPAQAHTIACPRCRRGAVGFVAADVRGVAVAHPLAAGPASRAVREAARGHGLPVPDAAAASGPTVFAGGEMVTRCRRCGPVTVPESQVELALVQAARRYGVRVRR